MQATVLRRETPSKRDLPHPRAAVSGRMSAADFRTLMGRSSGRKAASDSPARAVHSSASIRRAKAAELPRGPVSKLPLEFALPFLPPSVNAIFAVVTDTADGKPKRVLTAKARRARAAIASFVQGRLSPDEIYELHITVELSAVSKEGKLKKVDLTNRVKFLEDCVAARLGIDDRQFFRVVLDKLDAQHERTLIKILPYQKGSAGSKPASA